MKKAYIMCGVPGSGKSTYIKGMKIDDSFVIVSTDGHVERHAESLGKTYDEVFRDFMPHAIEMMNRDVDQAIEAGKSIIWDQTNLSVKSRAFKFQRLKGYKMIAIVFDTPPMNELQKRLNGRKGKHIPEGVIESMIKNFSVPTMQEGFDIIFHVNASLDSSLEP